MTAFVGAGVVVLGTATLSHAPSHQSLHPSKASAAFTLDDLNSRQVSVDRANRATDPRGVPTANQAGTAASTVDPVADGLWLLPLHNYTMAMPFGVHDATVQPGVTLAAHNGTPFVAAHSGTVTLARFAGATGYTIVIDTGSGAQVVYGHADRLLVREGQKVQAGDVIGLVGTSGYSYGSSLFFEIRRDNTSVDPAAFLLARGVDLNKATQAVDLP
jgi:murein DD-endopeptidase MepM/ murein hydrolase activator NlpD